MRLVATGVVALGLLGEACVIGARPARPSSLPPRPASVTVRMTEYRFAVGATVPSGRVVFDVSNAGAVDHALTLISIPDDYPPLEEQLHSDVRRGAPTIARVPSRPPGGGSRFAVDLAPGRYGLVCFLVDPDGVLHALKGMNAEIRVS